MAKNDTAVDEPDNKPSLVSQIGAMVLVTILALGGGWGFGQFFLGAGPTLQGANSGHAGTTVTGEENGLKDTKTDHGTDEQSMASSNEEGDSIGEDAVRHVALEPIVTNVTTPEDTWVRLEMAVLFASDPEPDLVSAIHQDLFAYMRSVKLHEVAGASGYLHMRSDLKEIVRVRSQGLARDVLIKVLLFE